MNELKAATVKLLPTAVLVLGTITAPIIWGFMSYRPDLGPLPAPGPLPAAAPIEITAPPALVSVPAQVTIRQRQAEPPAAPVPVPDPLMSAYYQQAREMDAIRRQLTALEHLVRTGQAQARRIDTTTDENGNTDAARNDLYTDVNPPAVVDPMLKALARHPGARIIADPETGQYVPAVVEYRETSAGGGKQLHLLRKNGKLYGQTIIHRGSTPQPEPKPEPFRLSLGNN